MSNEADTAILRRVTIALTGARLPATLPLLLRCLARDPGVELHAIFIEDSDLLKAVSLPFTVEFCGLTNLARPINRELVESHFRREANAAQHGFASLAAASGSHWQFEIVREAPPAALASALAASDATLWPARAAGRAQHRPASVLAIVDSAPSAERAVALARQCADLGGLRLEVFALDGTPHSDANATPRPAATAIATDAIEPLLRRSDSALTIITAAVLERAGADLRELCELASAPLLVLR